MADKSQNTAAATVAVAGAGASPGPVKQVQAPTAAPVRATLPSLEATLAEELGGFDEDLVAAGKGAKANGKVSKVKPDLDLDDDGDDEGDEDLGDEAVAASALEESEAEGELESDGEGDGDPEGDEEEADADAEDPDKEKDKGDEAGKVRSKGLEALSEKFPWAKERIEKQSATIAALKAQVAQEAVVIEPMAISPLGHVATLTELDAEVREAKAVRDWVRQNPQGGVVKQGNGATLEITAEDAQARLTAAETTLEAWPEAKLRLEKRAAEKPWEQAEAVAPELFKKDSPDNKRALEILKACPELKVRMPNWEYVLACTVLAMRQQEEVSRGEARYVRLALDKEGKVIPPKKVVAKGAAGTKPAVTRAGQPRPPATPSDQRPPLKSGGGKADIGMLAERAAKSRSSEDLAAVLAAELAGGQ